jgi:hypothetical protein
MSDQPPILKDADEKLTLSVDWTDVLAVGETISGTPSWAVEGAAVSDASPLTVGSAGIAANIASALVQAGTLREVYTVRCRMLTSTGQSYDRSWTVRIGTR